MFKNCLDLFQYTATPIVRFISRNASVEWGYAWIAIVLASVFAAAAMGAGCSMSTGKTTYYENGQIVRIEETKENASTVQSVTTVFGVRIKTVAPTTSDAAPVELDLGLARNALQVTPMGEKSRMKTDWSGIMWWDTNKLNNDLSVNTEIGDK